MGSLRNGAIRAKILIWGAPKAGKTATLQHVASKLKANQKGDLQKVTLKGAEPCNYELLPVELGDVKGVPTKLDFQTVPGPWSHASARKRLLQGVDGIVFVANSLGSAMKENQKSLAELDDALKSMGRSLVTVPVVFQWMNQKAIGSTPPDEMHAKLNKVGAQSFSVPQDDPSGLLKAFAAISKMAVKVVRDDYDAGKLQEPPPMDLDLDSLEAPPPLEPTEPDDVGTVNPFADLDGELDGLTGLTDDKPSAKPMVSVSLDTDEQADLDALLNDDLPKSPTMKAMPAPSKNGAGKFKLLSTGDPEVGPDGTIAIPVKLGNDHGDEVSVTISVKVTPS